MAAKSKIEDTPVTKREMINYIGPIFEDLKTEVRRDIGMNSTKIRELGVILESTKSEVISALETFFAVSAKTEVVENHGERFLF